MIAILKSEYYRYRHTWLTPVHLALPILYALLFFGGAKITSLKNFEPATIIENYLVILGAVFPIVSGAITSKMADMEANAGHFQVILSTTQSRYKAYSGKIMILILGLLFADSLAVGLFAVLFGQQRLIDWVIELALIFVGSLAIYFIHLWAAMRLSIGASIGLGIVETLLALLAMTSLGDKIWYFLPCTWPSRLPATYVIATQLGKRSLLYKELISWGYAAIPMTLLILIGSLLWFNKWEGQSFNE